MIGARKTKSYSPPDTGDRLGTQQAMRKDSQGRPLPPRMHQKHGRYYYVRRNKWRPLSRDYHKALGQVASIESPSGDWGKREVYPSFEELFRKKFREEMNNKYEVKREIEKQVAQRVQSLVKQDYNKVIEKIVDQLSGTKLVQK